MTSSDPAALAAAVHALERRVRWLHALCVFLALGWLLVVAQRWLPSPIASARQFVALDARGKVRAELGIASNGEPVLRLNNAAGKERILMGLRPDGPIELRLTDHDHVHRASLYLAEDGWPSMALAGPDGRSIMRFDTNERGGAISMRDSTGQVRWLLP